MSTKPILNIVTALHCEAKPLIAHFQLNKMTPKMGENYPFPLFSNKDQTVNLIIAGVGKIKTASATTFLHYFHGNHKHSCYLNIGIAGSKHYPLGMAILANKITENSTQRSWFPFISNIKNQSQGQLTTHDLPQKDYPEKGMIDMEASSFFQTAIQFVSHEQVQVLKIISDNDVITQKQINDVYVKDLISKKIDDINKLSHYLMKLSLTETEIHSNTETLSQFHKKWHFTYTESMQLKELLRKWQTLIQDTHPFELCQHELNAKNILKTLTHKIEMVYANNLY